MDNPDNIVKEIVINPKRSNAFYEAFCAIGSIAVAFHIWNSGKEIKNLKERLDDLESPNVPRNKS